MKKTLLIGVMALFASTTSLGQFATDFDVPDCDGNNYDLFENLNDGKVVVIAWIMPCATCITDPVNALTTVQGYDVSHPNKIDYLLVDDYANTNCASLNSWAANYGLGNEITISNAAISMSDYGVDGMPKIVIIGGTTGKVYFNENSSTSGFQTALDLALTENPGVVGVESNSKFNFNISAYPNPANNELNLNYSINNNAEVRFEVMDMLGSKVVMTQNEGNIVSGDYSSKMDISSLPNGIYFLKAKSASEVKTIKFVVAH